MARWTEEQLIAHVSRQSGALRHRNEAAIVQMGFDLGGSQAVEPATLGGGRTTGRAGPSCPLEKEEARRFMHRVFMYQDRHQCLRTLYHIANGGKREIEVAVELKRQGVRAGIVDYCLPTARHGYSALYIELKRLRGSGTSPEQVEMIERLRVEGNLVEVCRGHQAAIAALERYLGIELPLRMMG